VLRSLPDDLDPTTAQGWIENQEALHKALREALVPRATTLPPKSKPPAYPASNEIFSLTITKSFDGFEMLLDDGFKNWHAWRFTGGTITAPQTKCFKLVSIGYQPDFEAVKRELEKHGRIPQGQWRKAFKKAFPQTDGSRIFVADPAWVDPHGLVHFPCVLDNGDEEFYRVDRDLGSNCRWLVEVA